MRDNPTEGKPSGHGRFALLAKAKPVVVDSDGGDARVAAAGAHPKAGGDLIIQAQACSVPAQAAMVAELHEPVVVCELAKLAGHVRAGACQLWAQGGVDTRKVTGRAVTDVGAEQSTTAPLEDEDSRSAHLLYSQHHRLGADMQGGEGFLLEVDEVSHLEGADGWPESSTSHPGVRQSVAVLGDA